jgi:hypothetical protein
VGHQVDRTQIKKIPEGHSIPLAGTFVMSKKRSQDGDKREQLPLGDPRRIKDVSPFAATIEGLEMARKATRFQMLKIVNEVGAEETHTRLLA